ncbi:Hypothetical predicted protein [Pelobates cultripes]|uniref:Uncharacterized protein n=1 Tax=Pelobates cultripes TaxID=61616 RepID=A0AAD1SZY7_PELCU|nr:Hypothetical predicted protein [Pelobates cultripes]
MLLIHRVPKPRYLPDSAPQDVLLRAHYFHIKELALRTYRSKPDPHDLSVATLRRRREFQQITATLRDQGIRYRWGYPTKIILTRYGETKSFSTPEEGLKMLPRRYPFPDRPAGPKWSNRTV